MVRPPAVFGARRIVTDRLVCAWLVGRDDGRGPRGVTETETEPDGWWYTAPLPHGRRILAFHTDADLLASGTGRQARNLLRQALQLPGLAASLRHACFDPDAPLSICAAHGCRLEPPTGSAWFAAGDAALAFDPLSSQGLLNALYTGLAVAENAERWLSGESGVSAGYATELAQIWNAYARNLAGWYSEERRWSDAEFWRRRTESVRALQ
jgi:hypothetical protein